MQELLAQHTKQHEERPLVSLPRSWAESGGDKLKSRYKTAQAVTILGPQCLIIEPENTEPSMAAHSIEMCTTQYIDKNTRIRKNNAFAPTPQLKNHNDANSVLSNCAPSLLCVHCSEPFIGFNYRNMM